MIDVYEINAYRISIINDYENKNNKRTKEELDINEMFALFRLTMDGSFDSLDKNQTNLSIYTILSYLKYKFAIITSLAFVRVSSCPPHTPCSFGQQLVRATFQFDQL